MAFPEVIEELKKLIHRDDLREWLENQNHSSDDLKSYALLSYVDDWLRLTFSSQKFDFNHFVSDDLSSIMYGKCPVIFLGTNDWAIKRFYQQERLDSGLDKWRNHLKRITSRVTVPIYCCIVPEKDTLLRHFSKFDNSFSQLTNSVDLLMHEYDESIVGYSYMQGVKDVPDKRIVNYEYYDSHLLSRDYLRIFLNTMQGFGLINDFDNERIVLSPEKYVGDLAQKLGASSITSTYLALSYIDEGAKLVSGDKVFKKPLRNTMQSFKCANAVIKAKIVIYGDSHSSIYEQKKLTYLFANTFEECVFYWDPFSVNHKKLVKDADFVIFEISQRFMT